jgi:hypothetical protein
MPQDIVLHIPTIRGQTNGRFSRAMIMVRTTLGEEMYDSKGLVDS